MCYFYLRDINVVSSEADDVMGMSRSGEMPPPGARDMPSRASSGIERADSGDVMARYIYSYGPV